MASRQGQGQGGQIITEQQARSVSLNLLVCLTVGEAGEHDK